MKKRAEICKIIMVVIVCVTCILLLCGCSVPGNTETPTNTISPPPNIYVGMLYDAFDILFPDRCSGLWGYEFIYDEDGNPVVVQWGPLNVSVEQTVISITAYDKNTINLSEETFYEIEKGMTVNEVVALVGNPYGSVSAFYDLGWYCGDLRFDVRFIESKDDPSVLVVKHVLRHNMTDGTSEYLF